MREQATKQSWFFNHPGMIDEDGVCNQIPQLTDDVSSSHTEEMRNQSFGDNELRETQLVNTIRRLERFCVEVTSNKLLWSPEVLNFFQIPFAQVQKFEDERDQCQLLMQRKLEGIKRASTEERYGSYANLEDFIKSGAKESAAGGTGASDELEDLEQQRNLLEAGTQNMQVN